MKQICGNNKNSKDLWYNFGSTLLTLPFVNWGFACILIDWHKSGILELTISSKMDSNADSVKYLKRISSILFWNWKEYFFGPNKLLISNLRSVTIRKVAYQFSVSQISDELLHSLLHL